MFNYMFPQKRPIIVNTGIFFWCAFCCFIGLFLKNGVVLMYKILNFVEK